MSQVRPLHPTPQSFDSLMSELAASMASQQSDKILAELRSLISKEFAELRSNVIEQPLDGPKMAAFLNVSTRTLSRWIKDGIVPPYLVHRLTDGSLYMFPSQVVNHLKQL